MATIEDSAWQQGQAAAGQLQLHLSQEILAPERHRQACGVNFVTMLCYAPEGVFRS